MSMYTPGIKEELSEEAKMLVEDGGKVYRTGMPKEYDVIIESTLSFLSGGLGEGLSLVKGSYDVLKNILLSGGVPKVLIKAHYNYGHNWIEVLHPVHIGMSDSTTDTYIFVYVVSYDATVLIKINEDNTIDCND